MSLERIFILYVTVLSFLFFVGFADAAIITSQPNISVGEVFSNSFTAPDYYQINTQILSPTGGYNLQGTVKSIQLYGHGAFYSERQVTLYDLDSSTPFIFVGTSTPTNGVINFSPQNGAPVVLNPAHHYGLYYAGDATQLALYGSSATTSFDSGTNIYDWTNTPTMPTANGMYSIFFQLNDASSSPYIPGITPDTSLIDPCPILGIDVCTAFGKMLSWAFIVPQSVWDQFTTLKDDLKNKPPFGYFTSAMTAISGISTTTAAFTLQESTPIMTYIFNPLRTGLVWLLYFAAVVWLYKKLSAITV